MNLMLSAYGHYRSGFLPVDGGMLDQSATFVDAMSFIAAVVNQHEEIERRVEEALRAQFKPEFLNRVDETIVFHQLGREECERIVDIQLERVRKLLAERRLTLAVTEAAKKLLAEKGYDPHYGARPLKRVIQRVVLDPLSMKILEGDFPEGSRIVADTRPDGQALEFEKA